MVNDFEIKGADEDTLRKMQVMFMKSLMAGMNVDEPSASMLAIVERFLARMNMGLVDLPDESDMTEEETRRRLNIEYRKWSSRVTNFNSAIRDQAANMLNFIAEARAKYIS